MATTTPNDAPVITDLTDEQTADLTPDELAALEPTEAELEREQIAEDDELLADLPRLQAPSALRIKQQNMLKLARFKAAPVFEKLRELKAEKDDDEGVTGSELAADDYAGLLALVEQIDEFGEAIAHDKPAYIAWSEGKDESHFFALLRRYMRAQGE